MVHNIASDGPAGAGKSTVAQKVAKEVIKEVKQKMKIDYFS